MAIGGSAGFSCAQPTVIVSKLENKNRDKRLIRRMSLLQIALASAPTHCNLHDSSADDFASRGDVLRRLKPHCPYFFGLPKGPLTGRWRLLTDPQNAIFTLGFGSEGVSHLLVPQGHHRIDARRPSRGEKSS